MLLEQLLKYASHFSVAYVIFACFVDEFNLYGWGRVGDF